MNEELREQTLYLTRAITHLETTLHQDLMLIGLVLGILLIMLGCLMIILLAHRKKGS